MNPKTILCLALVLSGVLFGCSTVNESPRQYILTPDDPSERTDILSYSKPSKETLKRVKVARVSLTKEELKKSSALPKDVAIRDLRWLVEEKPDTMRVGPWNTRFRVFDASDTNHCIRVKLIDHAGYEIKHHWLNGKMLFVEVWWGRVAWTDFILNTETLRFAYIEDGCQIATLDGQKNNSP